jgi:hypothetical protein
MFRFLARRLGQRSWGGGSGQLVSLWTLAAGCGSDETLSTLLEVEVVSPSRGLLGFGSTVTTQTRGGSDSDETSQPLRYPKVMSLSHVSPGGWHAGRTAPMGGHPMGRAAWGTV